MTAKAPQTTVFTEITFTTPDPGANRFWHGIHNPASVKTPLTIELRERYAGVGVDKPIVLGFSRLIGKAHTIADEEQIIETMKEILIRAGDVDKFVGVLKKRGER